MTVKEFMSLGHFDNVIQTDSFGNKRKLHFMKFSWEKQISGCQFSSNDNDKFIYSGKYYLVEFWTDKNKPYFVASYDLDKIIELSRI